jgi:hypothetical protein
MLDFLLLSPNASSADSFIPFVHPGIASDAAPTPIAFKNSRRFKSLAIFELSINVLLLKFDVPNHIA